MYIIIKKDGARPTSKGGRVGFTPHWNRAIDKKPIFISTHQQYDRELKSRGLERAPDTRNIEHNIRERSRKPSKWAHDMARQIKRDTDDRGNYRPSTEFITELKKKGGLKPPPKNLPPSTTEGGMYVSD